jgi:large subunit ribosomal protein L31
VDAEIRCACGNVIKTRSTKQTVIVGICNVCHPFYTGQQKFVDTAGRVDKFQQRAAKTQPPSRGVRHEEEKESLAFRPNRPPFRNARAGRFVFARR